MNDFRRPSVRKVTNLSVQAFRRTVPITRTLTLSGMTISLMLVPRGTVSADWATLSKPKGTITRNSRASSLMGSP
ncbi:hypothetical protein D3C73_1424530 [compost metagenome]